MRATATRPVGTNTKDPDLIRDRREQLIRAALEVFQEKGFHATTVRDIGRAAGLTQGTIYNYVRSKEDILFLVCDRVIAEYISSMEEAVAATGDPVVRLLGIADVDGQCGHRQPISRHCRWQGAFDRRQSEQ